MRAPLQAPVQAKNQSENIQKASARGAAQQRDLVDNRPATVAQRKLAELLNTSPRVVAQRQKIDGLFGEVAQRKTAPVARANATGLPASLKAGIERLSGRSMDAVRVHYNSPQPAQLSAHAYAQGTEIHIGPGKEQHLPHEAWHVVQQQQGRVRQTMQMHNGVGVNADEALEREADQMGRQAAQAGIRNAAPADVPDARPVIATNAPVQRMMGLEWETGIAVVKGWHGKLNEVPDDVREEAKKKLKEKSDEPKANPEEKSDQPKLNVQPQASSGWTQETRDCIALMPNYRYGQDERIWTSGQGWVIDSDNSKLEFVTEPAVKLRAMNGVLASMRAGAMLLPPAVRNVPKYLHECGMPGAGIAVPVLLHYNTEKNFTPRVKGKPQITVGVKFSKLYEFVKFLLSNDLPSSEALHALHSKALPAKVAEAGQAASSSPSKEELTDAKNRELLAIEKKMQKSAMDTDKRDALMKLIKSIDDYASERNAASPSAASSISAAASRSAQFEHVKALVLMNLHYAQIVIGRSHSEKYKKRSFPLLLRSSFSAMYATLEDKAKEEYELMLTALMQGANLTANTILFKEVPGQMAFEAWKKSIITPLSRQISVLPTEPKHDASALAWKQFEEDFGKAFVMADLMTAPGAFESGGHPTDRSMGRFGALESDGDGDQLVVIELRDIAHFVEKNLGHHTADLISAFYLDLEGFAKHGFIRDE